MLNYSTINKKANMPAWVSPLVGIGLGSLAGIGVNKYLLKNKSNKSNILAALTGGVSGLALERLIDAAGESFAKNDTVKQAMTKDKLLAAMKEAGLPTDKDSVKAFDAYRQLNQPLVHTVLPGSGLGLGIAAQKLVNKARVKYLKAMADADIPGASFDYQDALQRSSIWDNLFKWQRYPGITNAKGVRVGGGQLVVPVSQRVKGLTGPVVGLVGGIVADRLASKYTDSLYADKLNVPTKDLKKALTFLTDK